MWNLISDWTILTIVASAVLSLGGLAAAVMIVMRMPQDHFLHREHQKSHRHPMLHVSWLIVKNLLGLAILGAGLAMSVLPGPGLLAILLGLSLVNLPGRRWLIERGLRLRSVRRTLNWIRIKTGQPPFRFPPRPLPTETS